MYYREFQRITKIEKILERLAYLSVILDAMVAVATFLVIRGVQAYSLMLTISNYLLTIEVGFAVVIFASLIALKHYRRVIDGVALATFRSPYVPINGVNGNLLLRKFFRTLLAPFASKQ